VSGATEKGQKNLGWLHIFVLVVSALACVYSWPVLNLQTNPLLALMHKKNLARTNPVAKCTLSKHFKLHELLLPRKMYKSLMERKRDRYFYIRRFHFVPNNKTFVELKATLK